MERLADSIRDEDHLLALAIELGAHLLDRPLALAKLAVDLLNPSVALGKLVVELLELLLELHAYLLERLLALAKLGRKRIRAPALAGEQKAKHKRQRQRAGGRSAYPSPWASQAAARVQWFTWLRSGGDIDHRQEPTLDGGRWVPRGNRIWQQPNHRT
jgi:hypothetical protein